MTELEMGHIVKMNEWKIEKLEKSFRILQKKYKELIKAKKIS